MPPADFAAGSHSAFGLVQHRWSILGPRLRQKRTRTRCQGKPGRRSVVHLEPAPLVDKRRSSGCEIILWAGACSTWRTKEQKKKSARDFSPFLDVKTARNAVERRAAFESKYRGIEGSRYRGGAEDEDGEDKGDGGGLETGSKCSFRTTARAFSQTGQAITVVH